jgi:hypothetical protein
MDIYLWSIEDRHTVRADAYGVRLELACFTDRRVAANFRDWLIELGTVDLLNDYLAQQKRRGHQAGDVPKELSWLIARIVERRQHPAQLITGENIEGIFMQEDAEHS